MPAPTTRQSTPSIVAPMRKPVPPRDSEAARAGDAALPTRRPTTLPMSVASNAPSMGPDDFIIALVLARGDPNVSSTTLFTRTRFVRLHIVTLHKLSSFEYYMRGAQKPNQTNPPPSRHRAHAANTRTYDMLSQTQCNRVQPNLSNQRYRVPEPRARAGTGNAPEIPSVGLGNTQYVFDKSRAPHRCGTVHVFGKWPAVCLRSGREGGGSGLHTSRVPSARACRGGSGLHSAPKRVLQSSMNIRKKAAERSRPRTS